MASIVIQDSPSPSAQLISHLGRFTPRSLPLLRRLQFALSARAPATPDSHVLLAQHAPPAVNDTPTTTTTTTTTVSQNHHHDGSSSSSSDPFTILPPATPFAAAYVDLSKGPETEVWLYCSLEAQLAGPATAADHDAAFELVRALLRRVKTLAEGFARARRERCYGAGVMVGSLDEGLRALLLGRGLTTNYWKPYDKWLFRVDELPGSEAEAGPLTEDMRWDVVRREDIGLIISRTNVPKAENTLIQLPSTAIRLRDDTPVAWAFLHIDGTLSTLHTEDPYRGRGIAKAVACRVIRDHNGEFGDDGWCSSDVHIDNVKSQRVCRSIGGKLGWKISWTAINLDSVGDGC